MMTILEDVLAELFGMFVGDARLSAAILTIVGIAAGLIELAHVQPIIGGGVLLVGCLGVVVLAVRWEANRRAAELETQRASGAA